MMSAYYKTEMLFPSRVINRLKDLRGQEWHKLVDKASALPEMHPGKLAFMLMMIRLNRCLKCDADSYRAMRGCELCSRQAIKRFKGTEQELLNQFKQARKDVLEYLEKQGIGLKRVA